MPTGLARRGLGWCLRIGVLAMALLGAASAADGALWLLAAALAILLYYPTRAFARWKRRRRDLAWLRYF